MKPCMDGSVIIGDEQEGGMFQKGNIVSVLANKGDNHGDFFGTVIGYKSDGIVQVKDYDNKVWDVGENQCKYSS